MAAAKRAKPARKPRRGPARRRSAATPRLARLGWLARRLRPDPRPALVAAALALLVGVAWLAWPDGDVRVVRRVEPAPPAAVVAAPSPRPVTGAPDAAPATRPAAARVAARTAPTQPVPPPASPGTGPAVAIVIDDVGPNAAAARDAAALEGPLTLAYLAYAEGLPALIADARRRGHEIFLHLAMAPEGDADPGPKALMAGLDEAELRTRTRWAIGRVEGAVGANNHMGSRLTAEPRAMAAVMDELARTGLVFLDSRTTSRSVAEQAARERGLATTGRDIFLDNTALTPAITAELDHAERIARERGTAVAIGHPYPQTLQALRAWLPAARARGVRLVTASEVMRLRVCAGGDGEACARVARGIAPEAR